MDGRTRQQPRVVGEHRADAHRHRVVEAPQAPGLAPLGRARDPLRVPIAGRDLAVEGEGGLQEDEGPPPADRNEERLVEEQGVALHDSSGHRDPGTSQPREPAAVHGRVRVARRDHDPPQAAGGQARRAGRSAALVGARLEVDVERGSPGPGAGLLEGQDLGVRGAGAAMPCLPDQPAALHDHAADHGVGVGLAPAPLGQVQGPRHPELVVRPRPHPRSPSAKASASKGSRSPSASPTPT